MDEIRPAPLVLRRIIPAVLGMLALAVALAILPVLALPAGLLLPLVCCYLYGRGLMAVAFVLPLAPAAAFAYGGGDATLALLLLALPYLCLAAVLLARRLRWSFTTKTVLCIAAYLAIGLGMAAQVRHMLGVSLFSGLSGYAVAKLGASAQAGNLLYRLASFGYLAVPEGLRDVAGLQLGGYVLLNPVLQRELLNMLRLRLTESLYVWLPTLLVQGALILGLFAALLEGRGQAHAAANAAQAPLFRTLHLPRREQRYMLLLCIGTVLASFSSQSYAVLLCAVLYAAFSGVYQLLGAAVLIYQLGAKHPARAPLYGTLAAVLYAVFPLALFLLGLMDQFMRLRAPTQPQHKEE